MGIPDLLQTLAGIDLSPLPDVTADKARIDSILAVVFSITGAIAFLVIVVAGFRYTVSEGDPTKTAQAKNTIIYAVIGLLVSIVAFSIVTFVINTV